MRYHNGWRGDHCKAESSPLVPNSYHTSGADPNMHHEGEHIHDDPGVPYSHHHQPQHLPPNQLMHHQLLYNTPPFFHHHSVPLPDLTSTLGQLAAGRKGLFNSLQNLSTRMDSVHRQNDQKFVQLAMGLGSINLDREGPPHLPSIHIPRLGNIPVHVTYQPSRMSLPSKGHYVRDHVKIVFQKPKIRENIRFGGDVKLLFHFLLDIHDYLDQHTTDFASDKRRIN